MGEALCDVILRGNTMKQTLKKQVEAVLIEMPEARNSDITLTIEVWRRFYEGKLKYASSGDAFPTLVSLKDLYDLPREDNIKRIRAKLNAEGRYWPTDLKIVLARGLNEDKWREDLGYPTRAETQNPTKQESYAAPVVGSEKTRCRGNGCYSYTEKTLSPSILKCPKGHFTKVNL